MTDGVEAEVLALSGSDRAADLTSSSDLFHTVLTVGGAALAADGDGDAHPDRWAVMCWWAFFHLKQGSSSQSSLCCQVKSLQY